MQRIMNLLPRYWYISLFAKLSVAKHLFAYVAKLGKLTLLMLKLVCFGQKQKTEDPGGVCIGRIASLSIHMAIA